MPVSDVEALLKLFRRHSHDVRNYLSGIDLDATLLAEFGDDPEITAIAERVRKQVARIESEVKLLLLKLDDPRPVTLTLGDLLQLWRIKLQPLAPATAGVQWPHVPGGPSITLDPRLTIQELCHLALWLWKRLPEATLEVKVREDHERVYIELYQPRYAPEPPADYVMEASAGLAGAGLELYSTRETNGARWAIGLGIPVHREATD